MFIWVTKFRGLTADFAHLPTLSRTFITGYICLTKNKFWIFHPVGVGGGREIYPILFHPNTCDLLLLLFYTTVSLDFGRYPISELTTHSPRMVNNQHHVHTPDLTRCYRAYEMHLCHFILCHATCIIRVTCNIYKFRIIIFHAYNFYLSHFSRQYVKQVYKNMIFFFYTQHHVIYFSNNNTQNGPNLGPT